MLFDLGNEYQRTQFAGKVKELWRTSSLIDLSVRHPNRTIKQNRYLHLIIGWWALNYGCSMEYAKRKFFKLECNKDTFLTIKTNKAGEQYYDLISTKDLTTEQMTICIERFRKMAVTFRHPKKGIFSPTLRESNKKTKSIYDKGIRLQHD